MDENHKNVRLSILKTEFETELFRLTWSIADHLMCLAKMVFDENGAPIDYIIQDVNPAYEKTFKVPRDLAMNKRATELYINCTHDWINKCGKAVRSGNRLTITDYCNESYLCYVVQVLPLNSADQFIIIAQELTRKEEEFLEVVDGFKEGSWIIDCLTGTVKSTEQWSNLIDLDPVT